MIAGNAPAAVQLKGPEIAEWNATGGTANLDELAAAEGWDKVVAPELLPVMKPAGNWVAAPMNIHRINWIWGSKKVMEAAGVAELPKTWAEFNADCDKVIAIGKICISHSTADWTDSTVFEVVVSTARTSTFTARLSSRAIPRPSARKAWSRRFDQMRLMTSKYMDPGMVGRDWDYMSVLVGQGDAAFHIMGDWTIGLFKAAGFKEGTDYVCAQAPTDWGKPGFILNSDSVVFFKQKDPDYVEGQKLLASTDPVSPEFQTVFNMPRARSRPAWTSTCARASTPASSSAAEPTCKASIEDGTLVRSMAHNMTIAQKFRGAIMDTITEFVNTPGHVVCGCRQRDG